MSESRIPRMWFSIGGGNYQIMLIDFEKASISTQGKSLSLTQVEKIEYQRKFPQIPPEVIEGESRQSTVSDMYAVGGVLIVLYRREWQYFHPIIQKDIA